MELAQELAEVELEFPPPRWLFSKLTEPAHVLAYVRVRLSSTAVRRGVIYVNLHSKQGVGRKVSSAEWG
jgi:hypothetical protein